MLPITQTMIYRKRHRLQAATIKAADPKIIAAINSLQYKLNHRLSWSNSYQKAKWRGTMSPPLFPLWDYFTK